MQAGKVSSKDESASCTNCGAGLYAFAGRTECTLCPRGQYSGEQAGFCPFCDKGYIAFKPGTVDCKACPAGETNKPFTSMTRIPSSDIFVFSYLRYLSVV